jgi:hypothetical protein
MTAIANAVSSTATSANLVCDTPFLTKIQAAVGTAFSPAMTACGTT